MNRAKFGAMLGATLLFAGQAYAGKIVTQTSDPNNLPPPGGWLLDLAPGAINFAGYQQYSTTFVATPGTTTVTWLFRNDPGFTAFDDASVVDTTNSGPERLTNGGFETGNTSGWTFLNQYGAGFAGVVATNNVGPGSNCGGPALVAHTGTHFWCDGATQGYDALDQAFNTNATVGDTYTVSFWTTQQNVTGGGPNTNYQQTSTNGCVSSTGPCAPGTLGNGDDILVYV